LQSIRFIRVVLNYETKSKRNERNETKRNASIISKYCQEFVNIDKDLQTVQDISDVNIIILIYLFIKHVLFILMYLHKCKIHVTMSVELKVYLFIWSHNFRFSMSLSLSPNSLYRQTTGCTEGGCLTREHCNWKRPLICELFFFFYHILIFLPPPPKELKCVQKLDLTIVSTGVDPGF
jgi:hypothetical protein